MYEETIKQLQRLKAIEPDPGFIRRSRTVIIAGNRVAVARPWYALPVMKLAGAFAVLILLFSASSVLFPPKLVLSSSLDAVSLENEIRDTIAIQVKEINYNVETNQAITSAIDEISDTNTKHLSPAVLENELDAMDVEGDATTTVDDLLEQILN